MLKFSKPDDTCPCTPLRSVKPTDGTGSDVGTHEEVHRRLAKTTVTRVVRVSDSEGLSSAYSMIDDPGRPREAQPLTGAFGVPRPADPDGPKNSKGASKS